MIRIAVIGGTGLEEPLKDAPSRRVETPFGPSQEVRVRRVGGKEVLFMARHGPGHEIPPHRVNYRANIWALKELGVERIVSTNAVGAINPKIAPGSLVIPHDIIDFTKSRPVTFFDGPEVVHVDMTTPYCPTVRAALIDASKGLRVYRRGVYACTEGPRFETPAEIRMMRGMNCDVVGMTNSPEVFLAREMEICYGALCYVSNKAAGMQNKLTASEVIRAGEMARGRLRRVVENAVALLPPERSCPCSTAKREARV